jgi:Ca2+-binding RTX toxin-like protein
MRRGLLASVALFFALPGAPALADHVTVSLHASARLGERLSDNSWSVIVDWSIDCSGPAPGNANYTGNLNLDDVDTGEVLYMGGTATASGSNAQPVERRTQPRRMRPRLKASCFDGGLGNHGSETVEVTGNIVSVPAKGDENGDGVPDGGGTPGGGGGGGPGGAGDQGRKDFPNAGFGRPNDPLRRGGCATQRLGTSRGETLDGTGAADLIFGLAGDDLIRGFGDDDCLVGGSGGDRLLGGSGYDRLTGGRGADTLVGGSGVNRYDAGAGNDVVNARNGRAELVSCGSGRDRARIDRRDRVRNCERVKRPRR